MRAPILTAIFLFIILAFASFGARTDTAPSPEIAAAGAVPISETPPVSAASYTVIKVVDGDTVTVNIRGTDTTLRLIGLDTPETVDPRKEVQCFGKEASERAKALLSGTSVRLEYDDSHGTLDKYGRTLAYIYMEDGSLFNERMILEGYGHEYTYAIPYRYQARFRAAEASARTQKKGLWADDACAATLSPALPVRTMPNSGYECGRNAYNCGDFSTQQDAQAVFDACGPSDVHKLDSDGDGEVCESLP